MPRPEATGQKVHTGQQIGTADIIDLRDDDCVWGAVEIARLWNVPTLNSVYWKLTKGLIPGARRVGRRWCASKRARREAFELSPPATS
jgi:hypothetical protein